MQQLIENTVGSLESLSTNEKSTIVAAVNENYNKIANLEENVTSNYLGSFDYWSGDLDNLKELGIWQTDGNDDPSTPSGYKTWNYPVQQYPDFINDGWNTVIVLKPNAKASQGNLIQLLYCWNDPEKYLYYRVCYGNIWTKWRRFLTYDTIPSILSNENLLINPDFRFNQREVTELISNGSLQYICDRWYHYSNDNYSVAKYINDKIVLYSGRIGQVIENIKTGTYTITIKISSTDTVVLVYKTGDILVGTIPAEAGEYSFVTILEDGNNFFIQANEPSTNGIVFEWIKLEESSVATKFVSPDPAEELLKCQRYYEKGINNYSLPVDELIPNYIQGVNFKVNKRAIPTITITDYEGTQHCATDVQGTKYNVLNTFHNEYGIQDVVIDSANHNVNRSIYYRFIADAEYY